MFSETRNRRLVLKHFLLAASLALFCSLTMPRANAQWWNPMDPTPPKYRGTAFETKPKYDHQLLSTAQSAIWQFMLDEDFAKIDRMYDEFMKAPIRASEGILMIDAFRRALGNLFMVKEEADLTRFFAVWREKSPDSRLRPVAQADMWQALAWKARGSAGSSRVTPEGKDLFQERLRLASRALEASADVGKDDPLWYWVALIVAGSSARPAAQFDALYDEAVTKFPAYLPLYYTRLNYLLPQWGGDWDAVDAFVQDAVKRTRATEGTTMYAWLYTDAFMKIDGNPFEVTKARWPALRASFEDMVKRYPDAYNRQLYLTYACLARDKETTGRLMTQNPGDVAFQRYGLTTEGCRRMAFERT